MLLLVLKKVAGFHLGSEASIVAIKQFAVGKIKFKLLLVWSSNTNQIFHVVAP